MTEKIIPEFIPEAKKTENNIKYELLEEPTATEPKKSDGRITCKICNKTFMKIANLNRHTKSVHASNEESTCRLCSKVFKSKIHLGHHERKVHSELFESVQTCEHCGRDFKSKAYLRRHMSETHPENAELIQCGQCIKRFKTLHYLNVHIRRVHNKDIPCEICGKMYSCELYVKRHKESAHLVRITPYVCPICTMPFNKLANLNFHVEHYHNTEGKIKCGECSKYYSNELSYQRHRWSAHSHQEPAVCPLCNRQYKSKYLLLHHLKVIHSPEHMCKICKSAFDNEILLYRHIQTVHYNMEANDKDARALSDKVENFPLIDTIINSNWNGVEQPKKRKYTFEWIDCKGGMKSN